MTGAQILEQFHRDAARHAAGLPPAEAERWILRHGLLSLARRPELPADLRERLEHPVRRNLARNLLHTARFRDAVDALGDLPVCPLKGIYLLATIYADDPEHRVMSDLDLLVHPDDASQAAARLESALPSLGETETSRSLRATTPARDLIGADTRIDLHVRLGYAAGSWSELELVPGDVHGRRVHVPDAETVLAHLIAHFVRHGPFLRLGWVEDLLRWIGRHPELDGRTLLQRARALGGRRAVVAGLRLLRRSFGIDPLPGLPPTQPAERLRLRLHEALIWRRISREPWTRGGDTTPWRRAVTGVLLADRPQHALTFLHSRVAERRRLSRSSVS